MLLAALASISVRGLRLIATQTLLFADIEGSAAMAVQLGAAWAVAVAVADHRRLLGAGLPAHGR